MAAEKHESNPDLAALEGGWEKDEGGEDVSGDRTSTPDLAAVDEGWLDDLFPEGDDADDEEPEEEEPELPDERLDPEAYAAAKKARDERAAARREKKKAKLEAKRARQRARAAEARAKQKGKQKAKSRPKPKPERVAKSKPATRDERAREEEAETADEELEAPRKKPPANTPLAKPGIATQWKLLAVAIAVFLGAAALAAALAR